MAAMVPEKSRTLHNFALPPRLNWGAQRLLRCSNNDAVPDRKRRHRNPTFRSSPSSSSDGAGGHQIDAIREKLMLDLRSEVDKMRTAFFTANGNCPPPPPPPPPPPSELRPWNLRARREMSETEVAPAPAPAKPRARFAVALSRQEIEDDFVEMMGRRPPRKPKKRPRYVQKQLDTLFPGLWLSEITADMYKVNENPEPPR